MPAQHADIMDADAKELRIEMFRQSRALLEAQRLASERLRGRIASTAQQCIAMAAAAIGGWAAVHSSTKPSLVFSCGLAAAAVFWTVAAIYSLRELRPYRWAAPALSPATFGLFLTEPDKPIGRIYEELAQHLYEGKVENDAYLGRLNIALDGILSLAIGGILAGAAAMLAIHLANPGFSGVNKLTIALSAGCAVALVCLRRHLFKRRADEQAKVVA